MLDIRRKISESGLIKSLIRDRRGSIAVYIAIITPVMIGIGAMTLDLGRLITLHSELQYAADSASLAGARELDRFPGAINRARAAAAGAVANIQTFANDGGGKQVVIDTTECANTPVAPCVRFLKSLPADDDDPILPSHVTTVDDEARFIDVHVGARAVTNMLIQIVTLGSGPSTISTVASAVAGNDSVICRIPPMFMCNPTEPDTNTNLELGTDVSLLEGRQLKLFLQGGGGQYTAGNFGLLCPTGTEDVTPCGGGFVRDALASTNGTCISMQLAETKTGVTLEMVRAGINARHDVFLPQAKNSNHVPWRTLDEFVPAANVTQRGAPKNTKGNQASCQYTDLDPNQAMGLPRDKCIIAGDGACAIAPGNINGNDRLGDTIWDYQNYFRINHPCDPALESCAGPPDWKPTDWDSVTNAVGWPPTRYETYRYEIERSPEAIVMPNQTIYDSNGNKLPPTTEDGHAQCFQGPTRPVIPGYNYYPSQVRDLALLNDRRVLPIAIANCNALVANGTKTSGKFAFQIPEMIFIFLTEPMKNPSDSEMYVEVLGELDAGAIRDLAHDIVQIYRR